MSVTMGLALGLAAVACSSSGASPDAVPEVLPRVEPGERLLEGDGFRVIVPASWRDLPDLHPADSPGMTVGDPREAVFLTVLLARVGGKSDSQLAPRLFLAELEKATAAAGAKVSRWEIEDTPQGVVAHTVVERGEMRAEGLRVAVVDDGHVRGWSADCLSKTIAPAPECARVLGSFEVVRRRRTP